MLLPIIHKSGMAIAILVMSLKQATGKFLTNMKTRESNHL